MREQHSYVGTSAGIHPDDTNTLDDPNLYNRRMPSSARRYQPTKQPQRHIQVTYHDEPYVPVQRRSRQAPTTQTPVAQIAGPKQRTRTFRVLLLGAVLFLLFCYCIYLLGCLFFAWIAGVSDNMHYGYPRTYQVDQDVGHGGVSHFIVINLGGHIDITEIPPDVSKSKIYANIILTGSGADSYPAIVTFERDTTTGKLDMIVNVNNTRYRYVNQDDGTFKEAS